MNRRIERASRKRNEYLFLMSESIYRRERDRNSCCSPWFQPLLIAIGCIWLHLVLYTNRINPLDFRGRVNFESDLVGIEWNTQILYIHLIFDFFHPMSIRYDPNRTDPILSVYAALASSAHHQRYGQLIASEVGRIFSNNVFQSGLVENSYCF